RLCETKCPVGAIDALGRINANECVLCLRCQVIMDDPTMCPVLIRRTRSAPMPPRGGGPAPASPPVPPPLRPTQVPSGAHVSAGDTAPAQPPAFQSQKVTP